MDSKYIHLIALIVAVFFAGVYLRGESARKKDFKRQIEAIQKRQAEINAIVDEIERVTAEKDSLLKLQIASAKAEVRRLETEGKQSVVRIDSLGRKIIEVQSVLVALGREINAVPDFIIDTENIHSVNVDPDISPGDSIAFNPIQTFVARPLRQAEVVEPPTPEFLAVARMFADKGVREVPKGSNRGPDVERFLAAVDLFPSKDRFGNWSSFPYCAAFVSFCLDEAGNVASPTIRTAGARKFITNESYKAETIEARIVQRGGTRIAPGTLVIWARNARNMQDPRGHVGFVIDWEGQAGTTVEANTGPGNEGNQRDGDGVYYRKRMLSPGSAFRITHFTPVILKEAEN